VVGDHQALSRRRRKRVADNLQHQPREGSDNGGALERTIGAVLNLGNRALVQGLVRAVGRGGVERRRPLVACGLLGKATERLLYGGGLKDCVRSWLVSGCLGLALGCSVKRGLSIC